MSEFGAGGSRTLSDDPQVFETAFAEAVRRARESKGISQRGLADMLAARGLQIDRSAVARIEKRDGTKPRSIGLGEALVIAEVLDINIERVVFALHPPTQHLHERLLQVDQSLEWARGAVSGWLSAVTELHELLTEFPDLLPELRSADGSHPTLDDFFLWHAARVAEEIREGTDVLRQADQQISDGYKALVRALVADVLEYDPNETPARPMAVHPRDLDALRENIDNEDGSSLIGLSLIQGRTVFLNCNDLAKDDVSQAVELFTAVAKEFGGGVRSIGDGFYLAVPGDAAGERDGHG